MSSKLLVSVGLVLVAVLVAGVLLPAPQDSSTTTVVGPQGPQGTQGPKGNTGLHGPRGPHGPVGPRGPAGADQLGSVVGPDQFLPYWNFNGLKRTYVEVRWNQATSTVCSIQSPFATSTLVWATVQQTEATSTDIQVGWGRGSGAEDFATTTLFDRTATTVPNVVFANNNTGIDDFVHSVVATTGVDAIDTDNRFASQFRSSRTLPIFSPNDRFNVRLDAKNLDGEADLVAVDSFNLEGTCNAIFQEL